MCGIVGRFNFRSGARVELQLLKKMSDLLAHRGPDGEGTYIAGPVGFGHRRLAVIDLTSAAHQPMVSENGESCITYNGEIYNYQELKKNLQSYGYRFQSQSDTEVVLASYLHYGVKCLDHLRGMFAFAIWDAREKTLFIARDRIGKKPLYYWEDQDGLAFSSEPKAFLADPTFKAEANVEAISHYLTLQYIPDPYSAFMGIAKLPPAHYMIVQDGKIKVEQYWRLSYENSFVGTIEEAEQQLLEKLTEAVKIRLVSDVPLGAFLSGGIDSSVVVSLMFQLGVSPLKTFSIGFEQAEYNELSYARLVANRFETDHHEFMVNPKATENFPKLVWHYNEPFGDSSGIPSFYLAELTRQHVTVALNGDGGDENLAGYDRYFANVIGNYCDHLPSILRRGLSLIGYFLPEPREAKALPGRVKKFLSVLGEAPENRYARWLSQFSSSLKQRVCTRDFLREAGEKKSEQIISDFYDNSDAIDFIDAMLNVDVKTYLPGDLLVKVDRATMAYGLEARSPFLDQNIMEFCASLPSHMKLRNCVKKLVLKNISRQMLPEEIIRRPKMGFGVPIDHWLRNELREMAYDTLLSTRAIHRGYFVEKEVRRLLDDHVNGKCAWHFQLWNLLMLELWNRQFIDGEWRSSFQFN